MRDFEVRDEKKNRVITAEDWNRLGGKMVMQRKRGSSPSRYTACKPDL